MTIARRPGPACDEVDHRGITPLDDLRRPATQHLVDRNSSVTTGTGAVGVKAGRLVLLSFADLAEGCAPHCRNLRIDRMESAPEQADAP